MKANAIKHIRIIILSLSLLIVSAGMSMAGTFKASHLYNLSDFTGPLTYSWGALSVDATRNEVYFIYQNLVKVFNENGMEIFQFGDDLQLGQVLGAAVDKNGDIVLLAYLEGRSTIIKCNYRGEPLGEIKLQRLPKDFADFNASQMVSRDGLLYLASHSEKKLVVAEADGTFVRGYDVFDMLPHMDKERNDIDLSTISVDQHNNILFTIPVLFSAFILSPEGKLTSFGRPGGAPGRFNVVGGMVSDSQGNYLVADMLKSAVIVFDKDLNFVKEFGYRGAQPGNLIGPRDLVIDGRDRLYVTQGRARGVSVFQLAYD